jgi:hypothetical protein
MRIQFTGPDKAPFAGKEFPAVNLDDAELDDIADLQRATGLKMEALITDAEAVESFGLQVLLFFTLRGAGHKVSWDTAKRIKLSQFETIEEPGDNLDEESTEEPTPTKAGTASHRPAAAKAKPAA